MRNTIILFLFVCLLGFIAALAGGIDWGTPAARSATLITFKLAGIISAAYLDIYLLSKLK